MTDAVEVMAQAFAANSPCEMSREEAVAATCAAIRALHDAGGLVVAKMPDDLPMMRTPEGYALVRGHNAALAAVRAAAVEVE